MKQSFSPPSIYSSLQIALQSLFNRQIFWRLLLPFAISLIFLVLLLFFLWSPLQIWLLDYFLGSHFFKIPLEFIGKNLGISAGTISNFFLFFVILFCSLIFLYLSTLILTSVLLIPLILPLYQQKYFSQLQKKEGLGFIHGGTENLKAFVIYIFLFFILLPLFLLPGLSLVIPLILNTFMNHKVFVIDVLQDYVDKEEFSKIKKQYSVGFFQLAFICSLIFYIPILNFIAPQISALAFAHYALSCLSEQRFKQSV